MSCLWQQLHATHLISAAAMRISSTGSCKSSIEYLVEAKQLPCACRKLLTHDVVIHVQATTTTTRASPLCRLHMDQHCSLLIAISAISPCDSLKPHTSNCRPARATAVGGRSNCQPPPTSNCLPARTSGGRPARATAVGRRGNCRPPLTSNCLSLIHI